MVENPHKIPGNPESLWIATTSSTSYSSLKESIKVDVAVVGAGIAGVTTAILLKEDGYSVALIERDRVGTTSTGYTTAKITSQHHLKYHELIESIGLDKARLYGEANEYGIKLVEELVKRYGIKCDFKRVPAYVYARDGESLDRGEIEVDAARRAGLPAEFVDDIPLPFETLGSIRFYNQARFHPLSYVQALAEEINGEGSYVFEETKAISIEDGSPHVVKTEGGEVMADHVVTTTNWPFYDYPGAYFMRMHQSRSYVIALRTPDDFPDSMFIGESHGSHSFRIQPVEGGRVIIMGSGEHKTGLGNDTTKYYKDLYDDAQSMFEIESVEYHWSNQDCVTADRIPYIGRHNPLTKRLYVATGFNLWGMSTGSLSGGLITDMINGENNPWDEVFNPLRFKPGKDISELVSQGKIVVKELMNARYQEPGAPQKVLDEVEMQLVCTHMGCKPKWNPAEESWDCPCHGSRFSKDGKIIRGPALKDLPKKS